MAHCFKNTPFGFMAEFDNGWEVSVQWGPGNYCQTRRLCGDMGINPFDGAFHNYSSINAEVRVMYVPTKQILALQPHEDVEGWVPPDDVMELMGIVKALPRRYLKHLPTLWRFEKTATTKCE